MSLNSYSDLLWKDEASPARELPALHLDYREGNLRRLGKAERLSSGAVRLNAYMTRTGVLDYEGDLREFRPAGEVFAPQSLASLKSAPVIVGHPPGGEVTLDNWKSLAVGHVESARRDGAFVVGTLIINDPGTIEKLESGQLSELSPGYLSEVVLLAGKSPEGEAYNRVQRNIRYNHLALLPAGMGRSGSEVRIRLDSQTLRGRAIAAGWTEEDFAALREVSALSQAATFPAEARADAKERLVEVDLEPNEVQALLRLAAHPKLRPSILSPEEAKSKAKKQAEKADADLPGSDEKVLQQLTRNLSMTNVTPEELYNLRSLATMARKLETLLSAAAGSPIKPTTELNGPHQDGVSDGEWLLSKIRG